MTVEVVETENRTESNKLSDEKIKAEHTLVQLYGRFAIIFGSLLVGLINLSVFRGIDQNITEINKLYGNIYLIAMKVKKKTFISSSAYIFFLINIIKLPFHIFFWKTINNYSLIESLKMTPFVILGLIMH